MNNLFDHADIVIGSTKVNGVKFTHTILQPKFLITGIIPFSTRYVNKMVKELYNLKESNYSREISNHRGYQSKDILDNKVFLPLIKSVCNIVKKSYGKKFAQFTTLWGNISPRGGYNRPHSHNEKVRGDIRSLSGVFYLKTPPNSGDINFCDPSNINHGVNVKPTPNKLLIFDPDIIHYVDPNNNPDNDRISLAFNIDVNLE